MLLLCLVQHAEGPTTVRSGSSLLCTSFKSLSLHRSSGVPRILEHTLPPHFDDAGDDVGWKYYAEYLLTTRININVRQVFPKGFCPKLGGEQ
jgi:alkylated DNA repair protein alkB homolog 1